MVTTSARRVSFSSDLLRTVSANQLIQFINARVLREGELRPNEHLWIRGGKIISAEKIFFEEKRSADIQVDCDGLIISPGFIDIQLNGGFGVDFSSYPDSDEQYLKNLHKVSYELLSHGVTAFVPTLITSSPDAYKQILPLLKKTPGGKHGAAILGAHVEGPFISRERKGCHPEHFVEEFGRDPVKKLKEVYGSLENITYITLAPELEQSEVAIKELRRRGVLVSLGHSSAHLKAGESGILAGATCLTHLFNAMNSYHHRDPGLIGLLTSKVVLKAHIPLYYGIIADGHHTDNSALRIAHRTHPEGLILVTDAMGALGMADGQHKLGEQTVVVKGIHATLEGTDNLAGSVVSIPYSVRHFIKAARCSIEEGLLAASKKPASFLSLSSKGSLSDGSDADLVIVNDNIDVLATFIDGQLVYHH